MPSAPCISTSHSSHDSYRIDSKAQRRKADAHGTYTSLCGLPTHLPIIATIAFAKSILTLNKITSIKRTLHIYRLNSVEVCYTTFQLSGWGWGLRCEKGQSFLTTNNPKPNKIIVISYSLSIFFRIRGNTAVCVGFECRSKWDISETRTRKAACIWTRRDVSPRKIT